MSRYPALSELVWPADPDSLAEAARWAEEVSDRVLDWIWRSFDEVLAKCLSNIDLNTPLEEIERDLVSKHFVELLRLWRMETDGFPTFFPVHEWPEVASRPKPPGRSPAYDLAFVADDNQRVAWPIEAKVLPTDSTLAKYMEDVNKFLTGTAAPFVGEGGVLGYLLSGTPAAFLAKLERTMKQPLGKAPKFSTRPHRTSTHSRAPAPRLRLHHMIMECPNARTGSRKAL